MQVDAVPQPSDDPASIDWAGVPAAPVVKPGEIWFDTPNVLIDGGRYSIGWQRWPEKIGRPRLRHGAAQRPRLVQDRGALSADR